MEIQKIYNEDELTVMIEGKIDSKTAPELSGELDGKLDNVKTLVLDFKNVPYISSAGVRALLWLQQIMDKQGTMKLINVSQDIKDLLDTIGFLSILTVS